MFNFFGKKSKATEPPKPQFQPVDLNATSHGISNRKNDTQLKLDQVEKELKGALVDYRQARTPQQKAQAKSKAMRIQFITKTLNDSKNKTKDLSNKTTGGSGVHYQIDLESEEEFDYFIELFKQVYDEKSLIQAII